MVKHSEFMFPNGFDQVESIFIFICSVLHFYKLRINCWTLSSNDWLTDNEFRSFDFCYFSYNSLDLVWYNCDLGYLCLCWCDFLGTLSLLVSMTSMFLPCISICLSLCLCLFFSWLVMRTYYGCDIIL